MDKHPKRKISSDNPYKISIYQNRYYIEFKDSTNVIQKIEISESVYKAFDSFELEDISQMHKKDKHIDYRILDGSEIIDNLIYQNSINQCKSIDEILEEKIQKEKLYKAIQTLSIIQKRRVRMYFFDGLTLKEIAKIENCSIKCIFTSIERAK